MKLLFVINHLNLHFPNDWKVRKGRHPKDGRVEGSACILSSENSKIAANGWTATDGRMVEPTQKRHRIQGQRRSLEKGRRGKITFRIKPHSCQRHSEVSNIPCVSQDPETSQGNVICVYWPVHQDYSWNQRQKWCWAQNLVRVTDLLILKPMLSALWCYFSRTRDQQYQDTCAS